MGFIMCQELIESNLKIQRRSHGVFWGMYGEVSSKILNVGEKQAEEALAMVERRPLD